MLNEMDILEDWAAIRKVSQPFYFDDSKIMSFLCDVNIIILYELYERIF